MRFSGCYGARILRRADLVPGDIRVCLGPVSARATLVPGVIGMGLELVATALDLVSDGFGT